LFSGIRVAQISQVDHDLDPLFRRELNVELSISVLGFLKAAEDVNDLIHPLLS
jgi:hypothetical protein